MSKMFGEITQTWNPVIGCLHDCSYCWSRKLAIGRLKSTPRYKDGFKPKLILTELKKHFTSGFIFVTDMGDLFGEWVPEEWIISVLEVIKKSPTAMFLLLTKNPSRYYSFKDYLPDNVVLGATVETNTRYNGVSRAPWVDDRLLAMAGIRKLLLQQRMLSIEPIMKFDERFTGFLESIQPLFIYIGYDNYNNTLPEPKLKETLELGKELSKFTEVRHKILREAWYE